MWSFCPCSTSSTLWPQTSLLKSRFSTWPSCLTSFRGVHGLLRWPGLCSPSGLTTCDSCTHAVELASQQRAFLWLLLLPSLHLKCYPYLATPLFFKTCIRDLYLPGSLPRPLLVSCKMPLFCAPKQPLLIFILELSYQRLTTLPAAWHVSGQES